MNTKLEEATIEVNELTILNHHGEAMVVVANYACDKHFELSDVTKLRGKLKSMLDFQKQLGFATHLLIEERNAIFNELKTYLDEDEIKAFSEVM